MTAGQDTCHPAHSGASPLGREVGYPTRYAPQVLFPIARAQGRGEIGVAGALPFIGHDRWHAYELGWLDPRGKPVTAVATITVPATSPFLIESKSLKLYLNSLNAHRFSDHKRARNTIAADLSQAAGAAVEVTFGLPPMETPMETLMEPGADGTAILLDDQDIAITQYAPPAPQFLQADGGELVSEVLCSQLLKSNCPVTGQPDWASVRIAYHGPRLERAGLLRYLVSFREHAEFHEQCVERIFTDVMARCRPQRLAVEARYTRRGGLDINPWRATPGHAPPVARRDLRQ